MRKEFDMEEKLMQLIQDANKAIKSLERRFSQCDKDREKLSNEVSILKQQQAIDQGQIQLCLQQIENLSKK